MSAYSPADLPKRLASRITVNESGCWLWGAATSRGYGHLKWNDRWTVAHRLVFHLLADPSLPIWPGVARRVELDHLCRTQRCVNPAHLDPVNTRENGLRGLQGALGRHTSRFIGVCWNSRRRVWRAQICADGKKRQLGYFHTEVAAAVAYDEAAEALHGDRTNERLGLFRAENASPPPPKQGRRTDHHDAAYDEDRHGR